MNDISIQKLQGLLDSGISFQEATAKLLQDGFTQLQITDAKIQLDAMSRTSKSDMPDISSHPELANELLHSADQMTSANKVISNDTETRVLLPGGINGTFGSGFHFGYVRGNLYSMIVGMLVILIAIFQL